MKIVIQFNPVRDILLTIGFGIALYVLGSPNPLAPKHDAFSGRQS